MCICEVSKPMAKRGQPEKKGNEDRRIGHIGVKEHWRIEADCCQFISIRELEFIS